MTTLTTFHLFPALPSELRNHIWNLSLPSPRILHVRPTGPPSDGYNCLSRWTYYTTKPSYGGRHPAILFANRESRSEALRHLTFKFDAYWNLEVDTLYLEHRAPAGSHDGMHQLWNLRARGMLDGFKHLALDWRIWGASMAEHCWESLSQLPNIQTCLCIYSDPQTQDPYIRKIDVVEPGVAWEIAPASDKIHQEVLNTVRGDMGKVIVSNGTALNWTFKKLTNESVEIGVASIRARKTVDEMVSMSRLEQERRMLDWFG